MDTAARWFAAVGRIADPRRRLLVFPHAGAGPYALNPLAGMAPPRTEVVALTLPGREHRSGEPPGTTLAEVLAAVDSALDAMPALPTVVFGCSVGALLAMRVAARRPAMFREIVVASQTPGSAPRPSLRATSDEELRSVLRDAGETPPSVLADRDFLAPLLPRLNADLSLGREVEHGFGDVRVPMPLTVFGGLSDALVPVGPLPGWAGHTTGLCRIVTLSGGHFAFLDRRHRGLVSAVLHTAFFDSD